ncbi:40S ribosomal S12 protein [Rutstroemia sp. NJR-2017a WRK4]|nr:40S ribosomal S12 protein [Rutstroemia sp. NJR-2017a WRK4]
MSIYSSVSLMKVFAKGSPYWRMYTPLFELAERIVEKKVRGQSKLKFATLNTIYNNILFEDQKISNNHNQDEEPTSPVVENAEEVEVSGDAEKGQMSVIDALKGVLRLALMHDGLARGLREASKALDRRQAHMCVLNEACEEEAYKKLVVALCSEHKIPLIKVPDGKQLGEWAGLCVLDREGNARKVVNCSCVVVKDWGEESQERTLLLNYFQTEQ